ncbi:MAG: hypothetical protein ACLUL2_11990 [Blautia sp.]
MNHGALYLHFCGTTALPFVKKIRDINPDILDLDENIALLCAWLLVCRNVLTNEGAASKIRGRRVPLPFSLRCLEGDGAPAAQKKSSSVKRAAEIMEEEYRGLAGIEELAARLDLSPETSVKSI